MLRQQRFLFATLARFLRSRRDLLDHVIVLNVEHLKQFMKYYVRYHHEDRTHLALATGTPAGREVASKFCHCGGIVSIARLGGLHHRYVVAA